MCFDKVWAVSDNGSTGALHVSGKSSILLRSTKQFAAVAHQVEQQTENLCVAGSSPARGTNLCPRSSMDRTSSS